MNKSEAIEILEEVKTLDDSMYQYNKTYLNALDMAIEALKAEAIPVKFIKDLYKEAIAYRDRFDSFWQAPAWDRADNQAIGINSVLQVWDDRHG